MANYVSMYTGPETDEATGKVLNPDATPTEGSANLVESGGVFSAIAAIAAAVDAGGKPLTVDASASVTATVAANRMLMCTGTPTALAITLGAPASDKSSEYVFTFAAGAGCTLAVTAPTGYSIVYPDGTPALTGGKLYEFNFMADTNSIIVGLYKEISLG